MPPHSLKNIIISRMSNKIEKKDKPKKIKNDKYKTELCKTFLEKGKCPYKKKCMFAHGEEQLKERRHNHAYKKKECLSFFEKGWCAYGSRCNFRHLEDEQTCLNNSFYSWRLALTIDDFEDDLRPMRRLDVFRQITDGCDSSASSTASESASVCSEEVNSNCQVTEVNKLIISVDKEFLFMI